MVIEQLEEVGFELVERSDLLSVPGDDHAEFAPADRWDIDRLVLKFRKP